MRVYKSALEPLLVSALAAIITRLDLTLFPDFVPVATVVLLPIAAALAEELTLRLLFTYPYDISTTELHALQRFGRLTELRLRRERFEDVDMSLAAPNMAEGRFYFMVRAWPLLEALELQCKAPLTAAAVGDAGNECRRLRELRLNAARCSPSGLGIGQHQLFCGQEKLFPHLETLWLMSAANEKRGER